MDLLPPEPPGYWKFKIVAAVAGGAALLGLGLIGDSDLNTTGGIASAGAGAALIALSLAGFLYYWRSI